MQKSIIFTCSHADTAAHMIHLSNKVSLHHTMFYSIMAYFVTLTAVLLTLQCCAAGYPWPDKVQQYKGYIDLDSPGGVHLFYWFFESRQDPSSDPLVLWLTGGPGCSDELAIFLENGPFVINGTAEPVLNPYGWNKFANILYVDQPAGTGFSYVDKPDEYVKNETQISMDLWNMMLKFYEKHSKYAKLDLYIFGESYAGHYVPAVSRAILASNSIYAKNFKGMAIGNGWTNPLLQYPQYAPFAYNVGIIEKGTVEKANSLYPKCKELIEAGKNEEAYETCEGIPSLILSAAEKKLHRSINEYDYKQTCSPPPLCYNMTNLTNFLAREDVIADLGVKGHKWSTCDEAVNRHLTNDEVLSFAGAVSMILDQEKQVLIYSGKLDLVCNYFGGRAWTNATKWSGQMQFKNTPYKDWIVDGSKAGEVKAYKNFAFLEVEDASHQVPLSVPKQALDILDRFIHGKPFA